MLLCTGLQRKVRVGFGPQSAWHHIMITHQYFAYDSMNWIQTHDHVG